MLLFLHYKYWCCVKAHTASCIFDILDNAAVKHIDSSIYVSVFMNVTAVIVCWAPNTSKKPPFTS